MQIAVLIVISVIVFWIIKLDKLDIIKTGPELNIPGYDLIYTDQKGDFGSGVAVSKILFSPKHNLRGKPDFIFANKTRFIPVEVKSGSGKNLSAPRKGDLMQLGAYFLLIEDVYGHEPIEGRILYKDALFIINNPRKLKKEVLSVMADMKNMGNRPPSVRGDFAKCKNCVCRGTVCDLAN
jgi:CRISPR-associated exonuclease Cas4